MRRLLTQGEKDERAARRRNERAAEKFPLLAQAGLLPRETAQSFARKCARYLGKLRHFDVEQRKCGNRLRAEVAERITEHELECLDEVCSTVYPGRPEYYADFWRQEHRRMKRKEGAMIDVSNDQAVTSSGERVVVQCPKQVMTKAEAFRHAAWLVALAQGLPDECSPFDEVLSAVLNG